MKDHFVNRTRLFWLLLVGIILFSCTTAQAQKPSLFDQWTHEDMLDIELDTKLSHLLDSNRLNNEYQDANFRYTNADGEEELFDMKIRLRGKFRRKNCVFPPIKLNFDKDDLKARGWRKDDEFKLVTPCIVGPLGRDYVLREYLAYKIFQEVSEVHFRVQLVRFVIKDRDSRKKLKGWGFIIEDEKTLANRFDLEKCDECYSLSPDKFDQKNLRRTALFQYLIGNADWSVTLAKNLEILRTEDQPYTYYAVPYDFDYSGFVNPSYATPNRDYNLTSVRDRIFLADLSDEDMQPAIRAFLEKKQTITDLIWNFKRLDYDSRNDLLEYVEECFRQIAQEGLKRPERLIGH